MTPEEAADELLIQFNRKGYKYYEPYREQFVEMFKSVFKYNEPQVLDVGSKFVFAKKINQTKPGLTVHILGEVNGIQVGTFYGRQSYFD